MRRLKKRESTAADAKCQYRRPRALAVQGEVSSVLFVFPLSGWEPEYGGFTSYIAKGEDEEVRVSLLIASSLS